MTRLPMHPRAGDPVRRLGMEELLCPDHAGIVDFEEFLTVIRNEHFNIITERSTERTNHVGYGLGHAVSLHTVSGEVLYRGGRAR